MKTQAPSNGGVEVEMASLGFGREVKPSVSVVKIDKTDWANMIR